MRLLLYTFALIIYFPAAAQVKFSKYFPAPEAITVDDKNFNKTGYDVGAEKCISGNCEDGNGTYLLVSLVIDPGKVATYTATANYFLYKGSFARKGYTFQGTYYHWTVPFEVVHDNTSVYRKKFISPRMQFNGNDEAWIAQHEIGNGPMQRVSSTGGLYTWYDGKMTGKLHDKNKSTAQGKLKNYEAWFDGSKMKYVDMTFEEGGAYKKMKGSVITGGVFVGGRLEFSDGGLYEGYLANGKFHGPGRYTNRSGEKTEGLWMLDSLASAMAVTLPPSLFEPVKPTGNSTKMKLQGWGDGREFYDAGDNWKYIDYGNTIIKSSNNALTGPGFDIKYDKENAASGGDYLFTSYYAGEFVNGDFVKGMRLRTQSKDGKTYEVSSVTGTFKDNMLTPGICARKFYYDTLGKAIKLYEGSFFTSKLGQEEFADGWIYVNDWNGMRDPVNLQYFYFGRELLSNITETRIKEGYQEAVKNTFCYSPMKQQSLAILPQLKFHYDSVIRIEENKSLAIKEREEKYRLWQESPAGKAYYAQIAQQQKTCDSVIRFNPYPPGSFFHTDRDTYILIISDIDCKTLSYKTVDRYYTPVKKGKGLNSIGNGRVSLKNLRKSDLREGKYSVCPQCGGRGGSFQKELNAVGGNSGYTDLGNGWAVKNPETFWVSNTYYSCGKCAELGFVKL